MIESYSYRRNDDYLRDVSRGGVVGAQLFGGYGERVTTGADSGVIWSNGAFVFPPAAGVQMSIVSTSANDSAAGTGARTIVVSYLDADLIEHSEVVTMNGLTPVLTVATNIRFIQTMRLATYGSGKSAAGNITASNGGNTHSEIYATKFRCSSSVRMVPAKKRLVVTSLYGGSASGTAAAKTILRLASPSHFDYDFTADSIFVPLFAATYQDSSSGLTIPCPISLTEGMSLGMTFETDKAATIVGSWFGWMENI